MMSQTEGVRLSSPAFPYVVKSGLESQSIYRTQGKEDTRIQTGLKVVDQSPEQDEQQDIGSVGRTPKKEKDVPFKTTLCFFFKKGRCANGSGCRFAHGSTELEVTPTANNGKVNGPKRRSKRSRRRKTRDRSDSTRCGSPTDLGSSPSYRDVLIGTGGGGGKEELEGGGGKEKAALGGENKKAALGGENKKAALGGENKKAALGGENKKAALGGENKKAALGGEGKKAALGGENKKAAPGPIQVACGGGGLVPFTPSLPSPMEDPKPPSPPPSPISRKPLSRPLSMSSSTTPSPPPSIESSQSEDWTQNEPETITDGGELLKQTVTLPVPLQAQRISSHVRRLRPARPLEPSQMSVGAVEGGASIAMDRRPPPRTYSYIDGLDHASLRLAARQGFVYSYSTPEPMKPHTLDDTLACIREEEYLYEE